MSLPEASRKHVIALSFYGRSISEIQNLFYTEVNLSLHAKFIGIGFNLMRFSMCSNDSADFQPISQNHTTYYICSFSIFSNLNLRNPQEQDKKKRHVSKIVLTFHCYSDLKHVANSWPSRLNFKSFLDFYEIMSNHVIMEACHFRNDTQVIGQSHLVDLA